MEKTKYRTVSNGHWDYLQYLVVKKFLCFKFEEWNYIPKPYYNTFTGRSDPNGSHTLLNSLYDNPEGFMNKYPYIDEYLKIYEARQAELEAEANKELHKYETKKNTIRYFS